MAAPQAPAPATTSAPPLPPSATFPLSLPSSFSDTRNTTHPPTLLSHGAEAHLYLTHHLLARSSRICVLKHRPRKPYRHPTLDARLTRHRILSEARVLAKLRRDTATAGNFDGDGDDDGAGVDVPALWAADWEAGWLMMEYVRGGTVRERLGEWKAAHLRGLQQQQEGELRPQQQQLRLQQEEARGKTNNQLGRSSAEIGIGWGGSGGEGDEVKALLRRVGRAVGRLHRAGVVHGDLTTGNMLIRRVSDDGDDEEESRLTGTPISLPVSTAAAPPSLEGPITLIDFGLATQTVQDEDRAVDLYVLERALGSSHPGLEGWFDEVLMVGYDEELGGGSGGGKKDGEKGGTGRAGENVAHVKAVRRKLEEVRGRGRKRSMIG